MTLGISWRSIWATWPAGEEVPLDRKVDRFFEAWARSCEAYAQLYFYRLLTLA